MESEPAGGLHLFELFRDDGKVRLASHVGRAGDQADRKNEPFILPDGAPKPVDKDVLSGPAGSDNQQQLSFCAHHPFLHFQPGPLAIFFSPFPDFNTKRLAPNRNYGSGGRQGVPGVGHPEKPGAQGSH
jgi:hypothetical protein